MICELKKLKKNQLLILWNQNQPSASIETRGASNGRGGKANIMRLQLGRENMFRMECHNLRHSHLISLISSGAESADLPIFWGIKWGEEVEERVMLTRNKMLQIL